MLQKGIYIKAFICLLPITTSLRVYCQKNWESIIYWNNTNINLFNYDILNREIPRVHLTRNNISSPTHTAFANFAGDTVIAYIYPNRSHASYGGVRESKEKFNPVFKDTEFLSNTYPVLFHQVITIKINERTILSDADMDEILNSDSSINQYLQTIKLRDKGFLVLRCRLLNRDSIIISTKDKLTGRSLDEYKFYKTDPYPHIIASYDLSEKEQFGQLMQKRDSLQMQSANSELRFPDSIKVSPVHNDMLLLLKRFPESDTLRIEYRLLKASNVKDSAWNITENEIPVIQFNNLDKGEKYTLQLRYNLTPYAVKEYMIMVGIYWWQVAYMQVLIAFIAGILLTAIAWSIYKRRKEKQLALKEDKRKQLELQLNAVKAQLNPHFIFNALGTLQSLVNRIEIEKANIYLGRVSQLMRSTLENSTKFMTGLDEEISYLRNYLEIESLRFDFKYRIEVEENLAVQDIEIPSMFIQPIVENAIKHGLPAAQEGCLCITIKKEQHNLIILVKDNGMGFRGDVQQGRYGLNLTNERIRLLNQVLSPKQIGFSIESLPGSTTCIFKFENWI
jgi:hypothetical protein